MAEVNAPAPQMVGGSKWTFNDQWYWALAGFIPVLGLVFGIWLWFFKGLKKLAIITLLIAIVSSVVYGSFIYKNTNGNNSTAKTSVFSYQNLKNDSLSAGYPETTMSYSRPSEFVSTDNNKTYSKNYQHKLTIDGSQQAIGNLSVAIAHVTGKLPTVLPPIVAKDLASSPTSEAYKSQIKPLLAYATQQMKKTATNVSLSNVKAFNSANIKDKAWQFDLSATGIYGDKWVGKFIYTWGKNGIYYFMIAAPDANWQANQSTWQQMLDSIKIDQT